MGVRACVRACVCACVRACVCLIISIEGVEGWSWGSAIDGTGAYLIDRSPVYFHHLLDYLRCGKFFVVETHILQGTLLVMCVLFLG